VSYTTAAVAAILCLGGAALAGTEDDKKKGKRPGIELRSSPRFAFSPANILFVAELKGGDDVEELYCPEVEWEWGDGGKSIKEADCDPWVEGATIERRFSANHTLVRRDLPREGHAAQDGQERHVPVPRAHDSRGPRRSEPGSRRLA